MAHFANKQITNGRWARRAFRVLVFAGFVALLGTAAWFFRNPLLKFSAHAWRVTENFDAPVDAVILLDGGVEERTLSAYELYRRGFTKQIAIGKSRLDTAARFELSLPSARPAVSNAVPRQASNVGYTKLLFSSGFAGTIDLTNSGNAGFQWYPNSFLGGKANLAAIRPNADGSVTLLGDVTGTNAQIATGGMGQNGFVGTSFGGGGYFEAELSFNPQNVINGNFAGWPSFWSMAREHLTKNGDDQWPGQAAGYDHFIESDFFEYDLNPYTKQLNSYGAALHDWSGIWTPPSGYPSNIASAPTMIVPAGTDFTKLHKFGMLWVPATAKTQGYVKFYFDDTQVGQTITWNQLTKQAPNSYPLFGIIDQQHLVLILGTGVGMPMTVKSVNVWGA